MRRPAPLRQIATALLLATIAAFPGCGGGNSASVPLYACTGRVLVGGKPLPGVQVTFRPVGTNGQESSAPVPVAKTDDEGRFRLATTVGTDGAPVDGAPAGEYLVGLVTARRPDSADFLRQDSAPKSTTVVDRRYADPKTSGLKATIKAGENPLEPFDLEATGGAPLGR